MLQNAWFRKARARQRNKIANKEFKPRDRPGLGHPGIQDAIAQIDNVNMLPLFIYLLFYLLIYYLFIYLILIYSLLIFSVFDGIICYLSVFGTLAI